MDSADLDVDAKQHLYPIHESQKRSCHMAAPFFVDLIQTYSKKSLHPGTSGVTRLVPAHIPHRFSHPPDLRKILPAFLFTQTMITIQINFIDGRVIYDYFRVLPHFIFPAQQYGCAPPAVFLYHFMQKKIKRTLFSIKITNFVDS